MECEVATEAEDCANSVEFSAVAVVEASEVVADAVKIIFIILITKTSKNDSLFYKI